MQMGLVTVNKDCDFVSNLQIDDFADVFDGGLGELPGTQHLQLKPDAIPIVMANRRTPLAVRCKVHDLHTPLCANQTHKLVQWATIDLLATVDNTSLG